MKNFEMQWINEYLEDENLFDDYYDWLEGEEDSDDMRVEYLKATTLFYWEFEVWCKAQGYIESSEEYEEDIEAEISDYKYKIMQEEGYSHTFLFIKSF